MKKSENKYIRKLYIVADLLLSIAINILAFLSCWGFTEFTSNWLQAVIFCSSVAIVEVVVLAIIKTYRVLTHNFGIFETIKMMSVTLVVQIIAFIVAILLPIINTSTGFIWCWALSSLVLIFFIPSLRMGWRIFSILLYNFKNKSKETRTLVIGAGGAAKIFIDDSRTNKDNKNNIVVLVDDDPNKIGGTFSGLPVKGPVSEVSTVIDYFNIKEVIIAISDLSQERLHEILGYLETCNVRIRRMPLLSEMASPNARHVIDVNLDDLLCRDPIILDNHEVNNMLSGKTVLVTGAGGSIGSELVRQIFRTKPSTLILFDIYENGVYDIQQELVRIIRNEKITGIDLVTLIGSTYNEVRMEQVFKRYKPDYIYHAAAYKHVPLMEDSPAEAIRTNVIGTYNVAKLADKYKVNKMVLVSTDKAVRPTNVMGATKRFAETIIQYFADKSQTTAYAAVRFGNVLGSNGSVVPLFKKQIEAGGPITLTHKDIIRYFMTIPEAVSLILQCGLFAKGGEIFILDMGKAVKIINLAEKLIRQAGLIPNQDIKIVETGLRPGEKLYEELLLDITVHEKTANKRIFVEPREAVHPTEEEIVTISKAFDMEETSDVKTLLGQIITTYKQEEIK